MEMSLGQNCNISTITRWLAVKFGTQRMYPNDSGEGINNYGTSWLNGWSTIRITAANLRLFQLWTVSDVKHLCHFASYPKKIPKPFL